jgi:Uma2 family endonuclease
LTLFFEEMIQQLSPLSIEDELLYPDSDGKLLADNTTQLRLIFTIKGGLDTLFKDRNDVFVAADLLWYPVKLTQPQIIKQEEPKKQAPDVMVVLGRPKGDRGSYKQWEEDNIAPQVAFEILSPGNKKKEMETKFKFYQEHGIQEYYLYDPKKNRLQGWLRRGEKLEAISQMEDWRSPLLGIKFSTSEEDLVLFHPNGERFVDYVAVVEQRDRERQRAILAENERDLAQQRADLARAEKERERQEKEQIQSELQKLREQLKQLNIDPDAFS